MLRTHTLYLLFVCHLRWCYQGHEWQTLMFFFPSLPLKGKGNLFAPFAIISKHICICVGLIRLMSMLVSVCLTDHILADHVGMIYKHILNGRESTGPQRSRIFPRDPEETLVGTPAQAQLLAWDSSHLTLSYSSRYMCVLRLKQRTPAAASCINCLDKTSKLF